MSINAFIRQAWSNPALVWDPKQYGGIKRINVSPDKTWIPDIHAYWNTEEQFKYNGKKGNFRGKYFIEGLITPTFSVRDFSLYKGIYR